MTKGRSLAFRWRSHGVLGVGSVSMTAFVVALLLPGALASTVVGVGGAHLSRGGSTTGAGSLSYCGSAMTAADTGYVCERATVVHGTGSARGWVQVQANTVDSNLSGNHAFWAVGSLNLSAGYAQVRVSCANSVGNASAQVYLFWHVWVYDETRGYYADQTNSGYIWNSNSVGCPAGGGSVIVYSPAIKGAFNSSSYGFTFLTGFAAGHTYLFTFFLGCTASATVTTSEAPNLAVAGAFCNVPSSPAKNTFTLTSVDVN